VPFRGEVTEYQVSRSDLLAAWQRRDRELDLSGRTRAVTVAGTPLVFLADRDNTTWRVSSFGHANFWRRVFDLAKEKDIAEGNYSVLRVPILNLAFLLVGDREQRKVIALFPSEYPPLQRGQTLDFSDWVAAVAPYAQLAMPDMGYR
jgi:hypothetical protein